MENELSPASIAHGLGTAFVGGRILCYPSVSSTMDIARKEAQSGAPEGTVVLADEQTLGKGRLKRTWITPPGSSIAMSVILRPSVAHLPYLIMVTSLAVLKAIKETTFIEPQIKWPNDVLINGKKVCGILIENGWRGNTVDYAVIGIGINVNLKSADYPDISVSATTLSDELGRSVSRLSVVRSLLKEIERLYLSLRGENSVFQEWRDNLITLGKKVRVTSSSSIHEGTAESVAPDGSLMLRSSDGRLIKIVADDVTLRE